MVNASGESELQIRIHGDKSKPCLVYIPGVHGDWTLFASFRELAKEHFFLVEITYPRTLVWTMEDYARAVSKRVEECGISRAWILAESYSSQVAWAWLNLAQTGATAFQFDGIVLAGGFVRYPFPWMVRAVGVFLDLTPSWLWKILFRIYRWYSGFRHRNAPESADSAHEFVARRTKLDVAAMRHRLRLIHEYDPREIAAAATCPIYLRAGYIDPVVPTRPVLRWLRKNCPAFREHRIIRLADHNVLGTEPAKALQVLSWIENPLQRSVDRDSRGRVLSQHQSNDGQDPLR